MNRLDQIKDRFRRGFSLTNCEDERWLISEVERLNKDIPDPALMAAVAELMELMSHGYVPPVWWTVVLEIKSLLPPDAEEG